MVGIHFAQPEDSNFSIAQAIQHIEFIVATYNPLIVVVLLSFS